MYDKVCEVITDMLCIRDTHSLCMAADNAVKRRSLLPGQRNGAASDRKRRRWRGQEHDNICFIYGNRAFMPDEVIDEARPQLEKAVKKRGCDFISMDVGRPATALPKRCAKGRYTRGPGREQGGSLTA